ncbi:hypothetical protein, partial [Salmonella sp. s51228]|uniref:hypothetical protein n=1 Tax=Salmonella sp. s51228 TaxID=3159652 RepID=UPI00397F874E
KYGIKEGIPMIALFESGNCTVKEKNKKRLKLKFLDLKENNYSQKRIHIDELSEEVNNFLNECSKINSNSNLGVRCQDKIKIHIVSNKKSVRGV